MKITHKLAYLVILAALALAPIALGQATVNESLETASVYVDAVNGSDSNPGTQELPLKTIGAGVTMAVNNNHKNIGSKIIVNPGTYRESVSINSNPKDTAMPITLQAAQNGTAIMSGADVWTGWEASAINGNLYYNTWPYHWGPCSAQALGNGPAPSEIILRREMIFVDSQPLTQVLAISEMVYPGTFYVDQEGGAVYVYPPQGVDMSTATVEVSTRGELFASNNKSNWVLRGMTFQYATGCHADHTVAFTGKGSNILVDSCLFTWNNSDGLRLANPMTYYTVQNSAALHNGGMGFDDYEMKYGLWSSDQTSYNNWRGAQGASYDWDGGGAYFFNQHQVQLENFVASYNETNGIHWDTDQQNVIASGLFVANNLGTGAFVEKTEGPITVQNSNFCYNGNPGEQTTGVHDGFLIRNSTNVSLLSDVIYSTGTAQLGILGTPGGIVVQNWETGKSYNLVTQNLTLSQDTFESTAPVLQVFRDESTLGGADWTAFQTTLSSDNNTWWSVDSVGVFDLPTKFNQKFAYWQSVTGQDAHSVFAAPQVDPAVACATSRTSRISGWSLTMHLRFLERVRSPFTSRSYRWASRGMSNCKPWREQTFRDSHFPFRRDPWRPPAR